jgi:hypothetical protein
MQSKPIKPGIQQDEAEIKWLLNMNKSVWQV